MSESAIPVLMAQYLLLSFSKEIPNAPANANLEQIIKEHVKNLGTVKEFPVSMDLARFASMDQLMSVAEDLDKMDSQALSILTRTARAISDLTKKVKQDNERGWEDLIPGERMAELEVPEARVFVNDGDEVLGYPIDSYFEVWKWDEMTFNSHCPINEITQSFLQHVNQQDDELRAASAAYNEAGQKLLALRRKGEGSLLVKELDEIGSSMQYVANMDDYRASKARNAPMFVNTRNFTTKLVIVKNSGVQDFLKGYEDDRDYIVPQSAQLLKSDNEFTCFAFTMIRGHDECVQEFKEKGWHIREFQYKQNIREEIKKEAMDTVSEYVSESVRYSNHLTNTFSHVASVWAHIKALKIFVESTLRYGMPPNFGAFLVKTSPKNIPKIHADLATRYTDELAGSNDPDLSAALGEDSEYYPYVSFNLNLLSLLPK